VKGELAVSIFLAMFLVVSLMPNSEAGNPVDWEIEIDPSFVFITENITIVTYGEPEVYFVIQIYDIYNQSVNDAFIPVDEEGISKYVFKVPLEAPGGMYHAEATFEGEVMANESFEVVFDEVLYTKVRLDMLENDLEDIEKLMTQYRNTLIKELNEKEQIKNMAVIAVILAIICMALVFWKFRQLLTWTISFYEESGKKNKWKMLLSPRTRGYMGTLLTHVDGQLEAYQEKRRKELGENTKQFHPFLTFPDKDGNAIRRDVQLVDPKKLGFGIKVADDAYEKVRDESVGPRIRRWKERRKVNDKTLDKVDNKVKIKRKRLNLLKKTKGDEK